LREINNPRVQKGVKDMKKGGLFPYRILVLPQLLSPPLRASPALPKSGLPCKGKQAGLALSPKSVKTPRFLDHEQCERERNLWKIVRKHKTAA
jgi:hypothetical protein